MNIHSLNISGFKSFGKKTEFIFSSAITGIVGPNGSGKSNITEAMRFVLGEQSFKSIRSKDVEDLFFRGEGSRTNMLSVAITFKDTESLMQNSESVFIKNALEAGSVEISRQVYLDGKNIYKINNSEVRLKDVQEMLGALSISLKSNWHISQGASDKILLASSLDRKSIIEDALGLRIYHSKIEDSVKKLEKSNINIREISLKRKELLPELENLSKQIEKIEKSKVYKIDLEKKWQDYAVLKNLEIVNKKNKLQILGGLEDLHIQKETIEKEIVLKQKSVYDSGFHDTNFLQNKKTEEEKMLDILKQKKLGLDTEYNNLLQKNSYSLIEEEKAREELQSIINDLQKIVGENNNMLFKESDVHTLTDELLILKQNIAAEESLKNIKNIFDKAMFFVSQMISKGALVSKDNIQEITYLQSMKTRLENKIQKINEERISFNTKEVDLKPQIENLNLQVNIVLANIEDFYTKIMEYKIVQAESQKDIAQIQNSLHDIENKILQANIVSEEINILEKDFDQDLYEVRSVLGTVAEEYKNISEKEFDEDLKNINLHDLYRQIERLKLKIEEVSIKNQDDISSEYNILKERDVFLLNEIEDLSNSIKNLEQIIKDLKEKLRADFENGINNINKVFDVYIKKLFGGGYGKVVIENILNKEKLEDKEGEENSENKIGVDVEIELPKKKVKGLHSLSGGERALTSIALNFAIIESNFTPFMVLDETDATLDEANAKRYGELLELIKEKTKLIVITHNRETMAFADQVYGITLEKSGASKVLSVSFEDALGYAK